MRFFLTLLVVLAAAIFSGCSDSDSTDTGTAKVQDPSLQDKIRLAKCLNEKGWLMYSSVTCSACIAQKELFGNAFVHIQEIECNPHAANSEVVRCIAKNIRKTPTWVWQVEGQEIMRLEAYQLLETLKQNSGCD